jgi:hypothetical protein
MRLLKGDYPLKARRLNLTLAQNLELGPGPAWLRLTGDNGLGKTSFIEMVLIPALTRQQIPFLYFGQDFRTQLYTLKTALAVSFNTRVPHDMTQLLTFWIGHHRQARVLILDEFDKYPAHTQHLYRLSREFIRSYVTVSHGDPPLGPGNAFAQRILQFQPSPAEGALLRVKLEEASPWS